MVFASQSGWLFADAPEQAKACHSRPALRPITIMIGNGPKPGEGSVTPGYAKGMDEGDYKTPPSGQWVSFDSAGSGDRAYLVCLVSLRGVIALDVSCHYGSEHQPSCSMQSGVDSNGTKTVLLAQQLPQVCGLPSHTHLSARCCSAVRACCVWPQMSHP